MISGWDDIKCHYETMTMFELGVGQIDKSAYSDERRHPKRRRTDFSYVFLCAILNETVRSPRFTVFLG